MLPQFRNGSIQVTNEKMLESWIVLAPIGWNFTSIAISAITNERRFFSNGDDGSLFTDVYLGLAAGNIH